jgi:hypothetical protein
MAKRDKDVAQAGELIVALVEKRPEELRLAWEEAYERGPQWRKLLLGGMKQLRPEARDLLLRVLERPREIQLEWVWPLPTRAHITILVAKS